MDDNHSIYYDCFIPFIVSLQETDYTGDVGVISHGLSQEKIDCLEKNGVKVFMVSHYCDDVALNRQLSVADIAEEYAYDQVVLYDADIWFPQKHLSVFEQITNPNALYCAYDVFPCTFMMDCVRPEDQSRIWKEIASVMERINNHVWQVGVVGGYRDAWQSYKKWALNELEQPEYLLDVYGIDTTFMNLYSARLQDKVARLPERYNCVPFWGIQINVDEAAGEYVHTLRGEPIEGIHVTRDFRKAGTYSYTKWHKDTYKKNAYKWRHKNYPYYSISIDSCTTPIDRQFKTEALTELEIESFKANRMSYLFEDDDTVFTMRGDSELVLKNTSSEDVVFTFYWRFSLSQLPLKAVYVLLDKNHHEFHVPSYHWHSETIKPGATITLKTEDVDVDGKAIDWVFKNIRFMKKTL